MFVKRKKNRSGTTSVVVAEKTKGIYKELITIGVAKDSNEIDSLVNAGHKWISKEESRYAMTKSGGFGLSTLGSSGREQRFSSYFFSHGFTKQ